MKKIIVLLTSLPAIFLLAYTSLYKIPYNFKEKEGVYFDFYYWNPFGVYFRNPRSCGFMGCIGPDIFPFIRDERIKGVNPFTFKHLENICPVKIHGVPDCSNVSEIFADARHVVVGAVAIPKSSPQHLVIKDGFAYDDFYVYTGEWVLIISDPATYVNLGCNFYRDKNNIYNEHSQQIKTSHFEIIERKPIDVDIESFKMADDCRDATYTAEDKNFYYISNNISGLTKIRK